MPTIYVYYDSQQLKGYKVICLMVSYIYIYIHTHTHCRHNTTKYLFSNGIIFIYYVNSKENITDSLTKKFVEKVYV